MGSLNRTQLSNLTLSPKKKPFPREKKEEGEKMAEEGGVPRTHKQSMATGDSIVSRQQFLTCEM